MLVLFVLTVPMRNGNILAGGVGVGSET